MKKSLSISLFCLLALSVVSCGGRNYGGNGRGSQMYTKVEDCCVPAECAACSDGNVVVNRHTPSEIALGKEFTVTLTAHAKCNCSGVVVKEITPNGLTYVSSTPPACQDGCNLEWDLGMMCDGECRQVQVTYVAAEEGCHSNCYSVSADPICCQCVRVGCPELKISCCGPEHVRVCCPVNYRVTVSNCGSMDAQDVVVTDQVPEQFEHSSCMKTLCWRIGDLCQCETRTFDVCYTAVRTGQACNCFTAQACGCPPVTSQCCTMVEECLIKLTKTGPKGPITVGKTADYTITATNEGNIPLTHVRVVDTVPNGLHIKNAPGAEVNGQRAVWVVDSFPAGQTMTFNLTVTSCIAGCLTNTVSVTTAERCGDCAYATTQWVGVAGIWAEARASCNPICLEGNGMTEYCIVVQNQGFADDHNVAVTLELPQQLEVVSANGATNAKIEGRTVTFDNLQNLQAGRSVYFTVKAKAVEAGDARVTLTVNTEMLSTPIIKEMSTNIY